MIKFRPFQLIKKFMPRSLFGRSLIIILLPLILLQVSLGYIFFERHTQTILKSTSSMIAGNVQILSSLANEGEDFSSIARLANESMGFDVHFDSSLKSLKKSATETDWLYRYMDDALRQHVHYPYALFMDEDGVYVDLILSEGLLKIKFLRKKLFSRTTPIVIIWTTISAILLFIIASIFMRNQIRPIRHLADAAEKFGKGIDIGRFKPEGADEVRKAGIAFNVMRERLKRQLTERTEMLAGVSHDLRTPLARMKLQLAMMTPSQEVSDLQEDVNQMQKMLQGFLDFARGLGRETVTTVDVQDLLMELCQQLKLKETIVTVVCPLSVKWPLKPEIFKRCISNLLLNSQRYATSITITVQARIKILLITIEDNGPGIPEDQRENVFQPFFRLDESRNVETGSVGLGLSIARDAIRSHGGQIILGESESKGLKVTLSIPK